MDVIDIVWTRVQGLAKGIVAALPSIVVALVLFTVCYVVSRVIRRLIGRVLRRGGRRTSVGMLVGKLVQSVLVLVALLVCATIIFPSFAVGDLVEVLGLTSVALGFAFRDILQNFVSGVLILWTRPFEIGDQIVFRDFEGTVEEIETRATFVRTYDGRRIVLPNGELYTNAVTVNTANDKRRLEHDIGIGVGDDIERAREVILDALATAPDILEEPAPDVRVVDLADFAVKLRVRWWITPPRRADLVAARDDVLTRLKHRLLAEGIDLPYPTTQVLFHDQTEETDGDRTRQREGWPAGNRAPRSRWRADREHRASQDERTTAAKDEPGRPERGTRAS